MSKRLKIMIPLFGLAIGVVAIGVIIIGALGYSLFAGKAGDAEVIFASTEVGTPEGSKVTKEIGPAGGSIASPDGRLLLTVPLNALTDTIAFSIQPITNKAEGGLGLAYSLEPNGKAFTTPLEISVHYDDHDLAGTVPEALSLAYQDQQGAWHLQKSAKLDKDKKTLTVSTTHFSMWSFGTLWKLSPSKATLRVGESLNISIMHCYRGFIYRLLSGFQDCGNGWWVNTGWTLFGDGKLTGNYPGMIYTAPGKKPKPNVATVVFSYTDEEKVSCPDSITTGNCYKTVRESLKSEITIVDRGYRVTGQSRDSVLSGVVCDLEKPFTVSAKSPLADFVFKFVPSTDKSGTASYATSYQMVTETGSGTYTLAGDGGDGFNIVLNFSSAATVLGRSIPGKGIANIHLTPLESGGCTEK